MKRCPFCAEEIQDEAIKCKHCASSVAAGPPSATHTGTSAQSSSSSFSVERPVPQDVAAEKRAPPSRSWMFVVLGILGAVGNGALALSPLLFLPQSLPAGSLIIGLALICFGCTWFGLASGMKGSVAMRWGAGFVIALMISAVAPGLGMLAWTIAHSNK